MESTSRRSTLQLLVLALRLVATQSQGRQLAEAAMGNTQGYPSAPTSVGPGELVNGTYEATYQEDTPRLFFRSAFRKVRCLQCSPPGRRLR